ncbi:hypothetical protein GUJ93_ZPchr0007g3132 [Zizania palustris]|uniref:Uncharacterized protein n=1 Tax=Zizania palustris TaxID=103762 RepID=A0A8J5SQD4_ZIZPA|nr:hypothetical protein GUJ93_ZPchr0007g3132 [Zizania palustris]
MTTIVSSSCSTGKENPSHAPIRSRPLRLDDRRRALEAMEGMWRKAKKALASVSACTSPPSPATGRTTVASDGGGRPVSGGPSPGLNPPK